MDRRVARRRSGSWWSRPRARGRPADEAEAREALVRRREAGGWSVLRLPTPAIRRSSSCVPLRGCECGPRGTNPLCVGKAASIPSLNRSRHTCCKIATIRWPEGGRWARGMRRKRSAGRRAQRGERIRRMSRSRIFLRNVLRLRPSSSAALIWLPRVAARQRRSAAARVRAGCGGRGPAAAIRRRASRTASTRWRSTAAESGSPRPRAPPAPSADGPRRLANGAVANPLASADSSMSTSCSLIAPAGRARPGAERDFPARGCCRASGSASCAPARPARDAWSGRPSLPPPG